MGVSATSPLRSVILLLPLLLDERRRKRGSGERVIRDEVEEARGYDTAYIS